MYLYFSICNCICHTKCKSIPAIRIEVYAEFQPIDDKLTRLKLLAKLKGFHLGAEVFYGPPKLQTISQDGPIEMNIVRKVHKIDRGRIYVV